MLGTTPIEFTLGSHARQGASCTHCVWGRNTQEVVRLHASRTLTLRGTVLPYDFLVPPMLMCTTLEDGERSDIAHGYVWPS